MRPLPDARLGEVRLTVSHLERALGFYTDVLGFTVLARDGAEARLGAQEGDTLLSLLGNPAARPRKPRSAGLYHVAILVPDRPALGRSLRRLAACRWPLTGASDHLVSEALYLDDPDGLGIEIYRDRPRTEWRHDAGEILMATDPLDLDALAGEPGAEGAWRGLEAATSVGHLHLHVPDLVEAERFYCGELGLQPTLRRYPGALFTAAGGYHHHVGLNVWAGRGVPPPETGTVGLEAFTLLAPAAERRTLVDSATGVTVYVRPQP